MADGEPEPLAVVLRGERVESVHCGHLVVLDPDCRPRLAVGDPRITIWPRSALTPVQAVAMLRAGLELDDAGIAVACASHSGTPEQVGIVHRILEDAGLTEADLRNTPGLPLDAESRQAWCAEGGVASSMTQTCSGKHAAMLATCVAAGWDIAGYLHPGHPLQQEVRAVVAELTDGPIVGVSVDECGAPLFSTSVLGLATALGRIAAAAAAVDPHAGGPVSAEARVGLAMRANPWLVGGPRRDVSGFMAAVPGLVAKDGAEGVYAAGLPDGSAIALKIADGSARPRAAIMAAALELALGVEVHARSASWQVIPAGVVVPGISGRARGDEDDGGAAGVGDAADGGGGGDGGAGAGGAMVSDDVVRAVREVGWTPVLGHGRPVGEVVAVMGDADAFGRTEIGRQW